MNPMNVAAAMRMAEGWANAAGLTLLWRAHPEATLNMLVDADATRRTHWRCAIELADACAAASSNQMPSVSPAPAAAVDCRKTRRETVPGTLECGGRMRSGFIVGSFSPAPWRRP